MSGIVDIERDLGSRARIVFVGSLENMEELEEA